MSVVKQKLRRVIALLIEAKSFEYRPVRSDIVRRRVDASRKGWRTRKRMAEARGRT